ncbi:hypothetical protein QJQ45_014285, partial [Haematococcus lacustris]
PALSHNWARWFNTRKLRNKGSQFERSVGTDGVSVCVHYTRPLPPPPAPPPAARSSSRPSAAAAAQAVGLPHIGRGIAETREHVFDPATQIGVGIDSGVTKAVSAASGVWNERSGQLVADKLARWKLTKGQVKHASGLNNARRDTKRWLAPIQPHLHLQHLAAATSAGTSLEANLKHITVTLATWNAVWEVYLDPKWARQRLRLYGAQDRALEQFFKELEKDMAEVSMERHGHAKQLVVFFGAASIGTARGPRGAGQLRGRVVLVDEHRTTRVSSAVNGKQPCEEELNHEQPIRRADWKPPAGQVEQRLVRPAWSQQRDQPVRGLMWCPVVEPRKPRQAPRSSQEATQPSASEPGLSTSPPAKRSKCTKAELAAEPIQPTKGEGKGKGKAAKAKLAPQPGRWLDRDCNAALNMQCIGESRWRPLELCWWPNQAALPAKGKEYPGLGYKRLRDKRPKAQDLFKPVLLPEQVEGIRLGDVGERGRTESPQSLHARTAPQLLLMELGRSQAVRMFLNALQPHPRHVLHDQGKRLVERSMAAYARTTRLVEDSVELALARAKAAATGVYEEFIGMLQLGRVASKPAAREPTSHTTADILTQLKGGDPAAVKTAQRLMRQLHTALTAHGTPAAPPTAPPKQWCEHHQRYTGRSTADCHMHRQQAASSQPPPPHAASLTATPAEQAMFEQFKAFMSTRPAAAPPPLRAHTPMQSRAGPSRQRPHCHHCGKDGHTTERCFAKHPELRPPSWGPPATSHSLLTMPSAALAAIDEGMEDETQPCTAVPTANARQARLAMQRALAAAAATTPADAVVPVPPPITSPQQSYNAMRHALAGTVVRPLGFAPGSAIVRAAPSTSSFSTGTTAAVQPPRLPLANVTNTRVQVLEAQGSSMQQQVLIMQAQLAQLHAERPLAQAVAAATASSTPSTQPAPTSFSVLDRHGNPHAMAGVMIDSGSGAQLMTAAVARQLQLEVLPSQLRIIQSGGAEFRTVGAAVIEVGLALGTPHTATSRHRFQVVADSSSLPYGLLVGTEIIHRHGIQLDLPGRLLTYAPALPAMASRILGMLCHCTLRHQQLGPAAPSSAKVVWLPAHAYNPSVAAGLSVRGSDGKLWAPSGVLLDSGSGVLLISQGLVELLRLSVDPYHLPVLESGGVAFNTVEHVMLEVGLALGTAHEACSWHRFYVVDSNLPPYTLLIGTEVMHQHGVRIDLRAHTFTYNSQLASLGQLHPRHALPLRFDISNFPHDDDPVSAYAHVDPLYACVACPAQCEGEQGGSGQAGVCYLGAPGVEPLVTSTTPVCSPAPTVAEANPVPEIRGLARGPCSKPGHGTARPQLPARSPKQQALGLGTARHRTRQQQRATATPPAGGSGWATAGQELLTTIRKGCTLRTITTLLLILYALLPTLHACPPNELPAVPALPDAYNSVTIERTLPGGQEHFPPDVRFTMHSKGMPFDNHPGMTPTEHAALQRLVEAHDSAFSYSLFDLPGYHGPRPPFSIPHTSDQPAAGIVSPVEGPCSYASAPVLPAKKDVHGQWTEKRFAIDYRQLNTVTKPDIYGLPR